MSLDRDIMYEINKHWLESAEKNIMKYNKGKPQLDLIPSEQLIQIAEVFGFGADKYGRNNWRDDGENTSWSQTYASVQRHLVAWNDCEDIDPESGFTHLAHAATQLIILMNHAKHKKQDDRYGKH